MQDVSELSYQPQGRERFRTADVLCFRGKGLFSWGIRRLTNSEYSHVGLSYLFEGRVYCLEAVGSGVRLILMSELVRRYKGGIDYFMVDGADEDQRKKAISFAFAQLGKLYDKPGIVRFLTAIVTKNMEKQRRDNKWFCSELVVAAYNEAEIALVDKQDHPEAYTAPSDLVNGGRLIPGFSLKE